MTDERLTNDEAAAINKAFAARCERFRCELDLALEAIAFDDFQRAALTAMLAKLVRCDDHDHPSETCGTETMFVLTVLGFPPLQGLFSFCWQLGYAEAVADLKAERLVV